MPSTDTSIHMGSTASRSVECDSAPLRSSHRPKEPSSRTEDFLWESFGSMAKSHERRQCYFHGDHPPPCARLTGSWTYVASATPSQVDSSGSLILRSLFQSLGRLDLYLWLGLAGDRPG